MALRERVLMQAATARDAAMTRDVLARTGIDCAPCDGVEALMREMHRGAGALVISEETLSNDAAERLGDCLRQQPEWSDLPILLLARQGAGTRVLTRLIEQIPNLTVLERPLRIGSFVSAVTLALRSRARQYELRDQLQALAELDRRKTEFLATLAHELRNPLAPLRTILAIMTAQTAPDVQGRRYLEIMERQVHHMTRLIDDLMEVSRITGGKIELQREVVGLDTVIAEAIELSRPSIEHRQHHLQVVAEATGLRIFADRVRMTQVFSNLLNNAAKYTPPGGRLTIHVDRRGKDAVIKVIDTGNGLDAQSLETIFDMFFQVQERGDVAAGGLGIGLTLVRSLVELHGGSVTADSAGRGKGSTFTVRIGLVGELEPGAQPALPTAGLSPLARPVRVLVVDDNRDAADSLKDLLSMMGACVLAVYDGRSALDEAHRDMPDVAIVDIGMPDMDGCEVARGLRQLAASDGLKLIALTGRGQFRDRESIARAGFDHHLIKPVNPAYLATLL